MNEVLTNSEERRNSEGRKEFTPTNSMLHFFMDNAGEYIASVMRAGKRPSAEGHFKFLCDSLHKHEDAEVRVGLAQSLMFLGFKEFMDIVGKSMDQMRRMAPSGLVEKLNKLSMEEIAKMDPEELKKLMEQGLGL